MKLAGWLIRTTDPSDCGPATRNLLKAVAERRAPDESFPVVLRQLLEDKKLVRIGKRKGTRYGWPRFPARRRLPA